MKISRAKRQIYYVGDSRDQECRTFFEKPSRDGIRVGLLVGELNRILEISDSGAGLKVKFKVYGCILHHFRDKARYWSKIVIFSYPLHSTPR